MGGVKFVHSMGYEDIWEIILEWEISPEGNLDRLQAIADRYELGYCGGLPHKLCIRLPI
jgi:hypothetical protein